MLAITNATLILPDRVLSDGMVLTDNGRILYAGHPRAIPEGAQVIDAGGLNVGPGFIDVHCHASNIRCGVDPAVYATEHLRHGSTSVLATLSYGTERAERLVQAHRIREAMKEYPSILGIFSEGPFKNPNFGAKAQFFTDPTIENATDLLDACGDALRMIMVSPDAENAEPILALVRERGIILATGHGSSSREQYAMLKRYGLRTATHHYCASGDYSHRGGVRTIGLDEFVDLDDDVYAEIIPDNDGRHVKPEYIRLCLRCKGWQKVLIVTDATAMIEHPIARPDGRFSFLPHDPDEVDVKFTESGGLSGSKLTMDKACFNMKRHSGLPTEIVWRMASEVPAKMLGLCGKIGALMEGADADIVIADDNFNVSRVISKGRPV